MEPDPEPLDEREDEPLSDPAFEALLVSCLEALERGDPLDHSQLLTDYPQYAEILEAFLADHAKLRQFASLARSRSSAPAAEGNAIEETIDSNPKGDGWSESERIKYIGEYEILHEIARGGMGVVFKARQENLKRIVALKVILGGHLASDEDVQRFHAEAEAAAQLEHPGIVPIFEIGSHDNQHYFSMAFVEGGSLQDRVKEGPVPPKEAAVYTRKIAEAVAYAHQHGVIHRDLKPGNVLVDQADEPKVTDFGLAKRIEGGSELTATGQILGTPSYMPPEQAAGDEATEVSDVYSLGAILYTLLTGRPPFHAATALETLNQVLHQDPVSPRSLNSQIPRDLDTICLKALRKGKDRRYESASSLADDIDRFLNNRPIAARPVGPLEKTWLWCRRRPTVAISITIIAIVLIAAALSISAQKRMARQQRAETLVEAVLTAKPEAVPYVAQSLTLLEEYTLPIVRAKFAVEKSPSRRLNAALALAAFGKVEHDFLVSNIPTAAASQCENLIDALKKKRDAAASDLMDAAAKAEARQAWADKARLAIVGLYLQDPRLAIEMTRLSANPIQRTTFVNAWSTWHAGVRDVRELVSRLNQPSLLSAVCLGLGNIPPQAMEDEDKAAWTPVLAELFRSHPDAVVHSAAGWTLRRWESPLPEIEPSNPVRTEQNWRVNRAGMTMVRIPAGSFRRQLRVSNKENPNEPSKLIEQRVVLTRPFFISDREITWRQFRRFMDDPNYPKDAKPDVELNSEGPRPVALPRWSHAVQFCNWLSQLEDLEPCYDTTGARSQAWRLHPDTNGYRLPTEAEWEYACRAGTTTLYSHADNEQLLDAYAVYGVRQAEVPGTKLPNSWGLFDMHGNMLEWCHDYYASFPKRPVLNDPQGPPDGPVRVLRGGRFDDVAKYTQSSFRGVFPSWRNFHATGFRVVRPLSATPTPQTQAEKASPPSSLREHSLHGRPLHVHTIHIRFSPDSSDPLRKRTHVVDGNEVDQLFDPAAPQQIDEAAKVLERFPETKVVIVGHTDGSMKGQVNEDKAKDLAARRAEGFLAALRKRHPELTNYEFSVEGAGWDEPLDPDYPNSQANRRLELQIFPLRAADN